MLGQSQKTIATNADITESAYATLDGIICLSIPEGVYVKPAFLIIEEASDSKSDKKIYVVGSKNKDLTYYDIYTRHSASVKSIESENEYYTVCRKPITKATKFEKAIIRLKNVDESDALEYPCEIYASRVIISFDGLKQLQKDVISFIQVVTERNKLAVEVEALRVEFPKDQKERLEKTIAEKDDFINQMKENRGALEANIDSLTNEINSLKSNLQEKDDNLQKSVIEQENESTKLQDTQNSLQKTIDEQNTENANQKTQIQLQETQAKQQENLLKEKDIKISTYYDKINDLGKENTELQKNLKEKQAIIDKTVKELQTTSDSLEKAQKDMESQSELHEAKTKDLASQIESANKVSAEYKNSLDKKNEENKDLNDKLKTANDNIKKLDTDLQKEVKKTKDLEFKSNTLSDDLKEAESDKKSLQNEIENLEKKVSELEDDLDKKKDEHQNLVNETDLIKIDAANFNKQLKEKDTNIKKLKEDNAEAGKIRKSLFIDLEKLQGDLKKANSTLEDLSNKEKKLNSEIATKSAQISSLTDELESSKNNNADMETENSRLQDELEEVQNKIQEQSQEVNVKNQDNKTLGTELDDLKKNKTKLTQDVEKKSKVIIDLENNLKDSKSKVLNLTSELKNSENSVKSLETELEDTKKNLEEKTQEIEVLKKETDELKNTIIEFETNKKGDSSTIKDFEKKSKSLQDTIDKRDKEKKTLETKFADLIKQKKLTDENLKAKEKDYKNLENDLKNANNTIQDLTDEINNKNTNITDSENEISKAKEDYQILEEKTWNLEKQIQDANSQADTKQKEIEICQNDFKNFEVKLTENNDQNSNLVDQLKQKEEQIHSFELQMKLFNEVKQNLDNDQNRQRREISELQFYAEEKVREFSVVESLHNNFKADSRKIASNVDMELKLKEKVIEEIAYNLHESEKRKEKLEFCFRQSNLKLDNFVLMIDKCEQNIQFLESKLNELEKSNIELSQSNREQFLEVQKLNHSQRFSQAKTISFDPKSTSQSKNRRGQLKRKLDHLLNKLLKQNDERIELLNKLGEQNIKNLALMMDPTKNSNDKGGLSMRKIESLKVMLKKELQERLLEINSQSSKVSIKEQKIEILQRDLKKLTGNAEKQEQMNELKSKSTSLFEELNSKEEKISEIRNEISCQLALRRTQENLIKNIEEMIIVFELNAENLNKTHQKSDDANDNISKINRIRKLCSDMNLMLFEKKFSLINRNSEEEAQNYDKFKSYNRNELGIILENSLDNIDTKRTLEESYKHKDLNQSNIAGDFSSNKQKNILKLEQDISKSFREILDLTTDLKLIDKNNKHEILDFNRLLENINKIHDNYDILSSSSQEMRKSLIQDLELKHQQKFQLYNILKLIDITSVEVFQSDALNKELVDRLAYQKLKKKFLDSEQNVFTIDKINIETLFDKLQSNNFDQKESSKYIDSPKKFDMFEHKIQKQASENSQCFDQTDISQIQNKYIEDSQVLQGQSTDPYLESLNTSVLARPVNQSIVHTKAEYVHQPLEHMRNIANYLAKTQSPTKVSQAISKENDALYKGPGYTVEIRQNPPDSDTNIKVKNTNDQAQKLKRAQTDKF